MVVRLLFLGCAIVCALYGCADAGMQLRSRAAREFACTEAQTKIVDAEAGVYRITGCGLEAGYQCTEDRTFNTRCQRLYLSKIGESAPKEAASGAALAKSQ